MILVKINYRNRHVWINKNMKSDIEKREKLFNWKLKEECSVLKIFVLLWMKSIHYPNTITSHLVTIAPMAPFTPKCTSKLRSALHIRYSKVIPRFISRANTAQT